MMTLRDVLSKNEKVNGFAGIEADRASPACSPTLESYVLDNTEAASKREENELPQPKELFKGSQSHLEGQLNTFEAAAPLPQCLGRRESTNLLHSLSTFGLRHAVRHPSFRWKRQSRDYKNGLIMLKQLFRELAANSNTGGTTIDKNTLLKYLPLPGLLGERLFAVFDNDHSGGIDFTEFLFGLAIVYGGSQEDKRRFLFNMYDLDGNGRIEREELRTLLTHLSAATKTTSATSDLFDMGAASLDETDIIFMDAQLQKKVDDIVNATFDEQSFPKKNSRAFDRTSPSKSEGLTYEQFVAAVSRSKEILEVLNLFYMDAMPELPVPRDTLDPKLLRQRVSSSGDLMFSDLLYGTPSTTVSVSASSDADSYSSFSGSPAGSIYPSGSKALCCPMCAQEVRLIHCPRCGNRLCGRKNMGSPSDYYCAECFWSLKDLRFCFACGQPLQFELATFGSIPSSNVKEQADFIGQQPTRLRSAEFTQRRDYERRNQISKTMHPLLKEKFAYSVGEKGRFFEDALKCGYLFKLGRKLGFWIKRYFIVKDRFLYISGSCTFSIEYAGPVCGIYRRREGYMYIVVGMNDSCDFEYAAAAKPMMALMNYEWYAICCDAAAFRSHDDVTPRLIAFLQGAFVGGANFSSSPNKFGIELIFPNGKQKMLFATSIAEHSDWLDVLQKATRCTSIHDTYSLHERIGWGQFSVVHRAVHRTSQKEVAVKILSKTNFNSENQEFLRNEVCVMKLIAHPNVVRLIDVIDSSKYLYLVMEYVKAGDLGRMISILKGKVISEHLIRHLIRQLLKGILYIHYRGIVHRDVKPENILIRPNLGILTSGDKERLGLPDVQVDEDFERNITILNDLFLREDVLVTGEAKNSMRNSKSQKYAMPNYNLFASLAQRAEPVDNSFDALLNSVELQDLKKKRLFHRSQTAQACGFLREGKRSLYWKRNMNDTKPEIYGKKVSQLFQKEGLMDAAIRTDVSSERSGELCPQHNGGTLCNSCIHGGLLDSQDALYKAPPEIAVFSPGHSRQAVVMPTPMSSCRKPTRAILLTSLFSKKVEAGKMSAKILYPLKHSGNQEPTGCFPVELPVHSAGVAPVDLLPASGVYFDKEVTKNRASNGVRDTANAANAMHTPYNSSYEAANSNKMKQVNTGFSTTLMNGYNREGSKANFVVLPQRICTLKISDFGLSKLLAPTVHANEALGTLAYAAPEVIRGDSYDKSIDIWSIGVMTYQLLSGGEMPFSGKSDDSLAEQVQSCNYTLDGAGFAGVSEQAKDFIQRLLSVNANRRLTCEEALRHAWIMDV